MDNEYKIDAENKWIPDGFHFLGPSASRKRKFANTLREFFVSRGYSEVIPPSFDFTSLFVNHLAQAERPNVLKVRDVTGREISPGADLTIQVVKGMAGFLEKHENHNVFYIGNTVKDNIKANAGRREVMQAGAEIIGSSDALTFKNLLKQIDEICELLQFKEKITIVLGNINIFSRLVSCLELTENEIKLLSRLVYAKQLSEIENFLKTNGKHGDIKALLLKLILSFDIEDVKEELLLISQKYSLELTGVLKDSEDIIHYVKQNCNRLDICLDFSMVRDLEYYTGFVFHAYLKNSFQPLLMGGAYDHLYEKFSGLEKEACGFALNLELIEEILDEL